MTPLRLGFIPLSDCAVLAVAQEMGFFRRHGLEVVLTREVSWANIRDKVAVGALEGAQMLAGMPIAATAGIDRLAEQRLITAFSLGLNGNAISVSADLWAQMEESDPVALERKPVSAAPLRRVIQARRGRGQPALRFATVYPFAMHNYELRYWLAAAGIDPDDDVHLTVVPPPRMVESLESGTIDGFCVGEPWNSLAVHRGIGRIVIGKQELWNNSPEKVLAVNESFAAERPGTHRALLRALLEAAAWADAAGNRGEVARILAQPQYVGADEAVLATSLADQLVLQPGAAPTPAPGFHVFHRYAANFPWTSHAAWLLTQMLRWSQISEAIDILAAARRVYRPDLYREAARDLGIAAPDVDLKSEGLHAHEWVLESSNGPIVMGSDLFFDGRVFQPGDVLSYVSGSIVGVPSVSADALAAVNAS